MREYFLGDKRKRKAYRIFVPTHDINCLPFEYFRLMQAYRLAKLEQDRLQATCPIPISDKLVMQSALQKTDEIIGQMLANSSPHPDIHKLFTDESLSYKDQERLLRGTTLTPTDMLWLNKEAEEVGYLMDIYHEEKDPQKFNEKKRPMMFHQQEDGTIEKMGTTDMSDGEMRALLEQRKVVQARLYHKGDIWHCFYFTFKGLAGEESGIMGSKPHYHYFSNKSGIAWGDLVKRIKDCDMPTSKVHIVIDR